MFEREKDGGCMGILSGYRHGDMWGHEDIEQQKENAMLQGGYTEEAPLNNWSIFWGLLNG